MGQMHAVKTENSERHKRILNVLKTAEHPLSGEEISARIQAIIGRIPQAVSTTIGEMRAPVNQAAGYVVSRATTWKSNPDIPGYIWHDGHPRYWLIAAPGWVPRWKVDKEGRILPCTERHEGRGTRDEGRQADMDQGDRVAVNYAITDGSVQTTREVPRTCRYCKAELPADKKDTAAFCNDEHKDAFWKKIREIGKSAAGIDTQEKMAL